MPEQFDPSWEYFTGDPEVEEFLAEMSGRKGCGNPLADTRQWKAGNCGYLTYRPGHQPYTFLARERITVERESACRRISCAWCKDDFTERRPLMGWCCSQYCAGQWRGRERRERPRLLACRVCAGEFEPMYAAQTICSRLCACLLAIKVTRVERLGDSGCPVCGGEVVACNKGNGKAKRFCTRRCLKISTRRAHRAKRKVAA